MSLCRAAFTSLACVVLLAGCSNNKPPIGGVGDDDGDDNPPPPHTDAAVADADPEAPDADESEPDADPEAPDASMPQGCGGSAARVPFASHPHPYASGTIKPAHSQAQLDSAVTDFYDAWKARYIADGCGGGRYLVQTGMGNSKTVSEAHGYGMVIAVFMAGYDDEAKTIFDGMYKYYLAHQSA